MYHPVVPPRTTLPVAHLGPSALEQHRCRTSMPARRAVAAAASQQGAAQPPVAPKECTSGWAAAPQWQVRCGWAACRSKGVERRLQTSEPSRLACMQFSVWINIASRRWWEQAGWPSPHFRCRPQPIVQRATQQLARCSRQLVHNCLCPCSRLAGLSIKQGCQQLAALWL